jgi:hypothetical protein
MSSQIISDFPADLEAVEWSSVPNNVKQQWTVLCGDHSDAQRSEANPPQEVFSHWGDTYMVGALVAQPQLDESVDTRLPRNRHVNTALNAYVAASTAPFVVASYGKKPGDTLDQDDEPDVLWVSAFKREELNGDGEPQNWPSQTFHESDHGDEETGGNVSGAKWTCIAGGTSVRVDPDASEWQNGQRWQKQCVDAEKTLKIDLHKTVPGEMTDPTTTSFGITHTSGEIGAMMKKRWLTRSQQRAYGQYGFSPSYPVITYLAKSYANATRETASGA